MKRTLVSFVSVIFAMIVFALFSNPVYAEGGFPIAENLELQTYRNVSVEGRLSGFDPDGETLQFVISTEPVKGEIDLKEDGHFVYTPRDGKRGRDYFGYRVVDTEGNCSQEATVIIRIEKQKKNVFYSDLAGDGLEYAALALAEHGIFTGEQIGGAYVFSAEKPLTRAEILHMCVQLSSDPAVVGVLHTGYADDALIPAWAKTDAVTAEMYGIYRGMPDDAAFSFRGGEPILFTEAAMMLNQCLKLTDTVPYTEEDAPQAIRAWTNLEHHGIVESLPLDDEILTRGQAARMLCAAIAFSN